MRALLLAGAAFIGIATTAQAEMRYFNLQAQPLRTALLEFGRQAGMQILVKDDRIAETVMAQPLVGEIEVEQALDRLLAGSGLRIVSIDGRTILLESAATPVRQQQGSASSLELEEIVVTARAGANALTKLEASAAITTITGETLRTRGPSSVAEALKSVPGFWVEASGGEASANVRARGIPVDGFGSIALLEDGLPIQHDPALGYLNADQAFRLDETIERVEVVRGGPSSIFTANAPGGAVNFITRQPRDEGEGLVKYQTGDKGLHRVDAWVGGDADGWKLGLGGFYRIEDGVRDPGFRANEGGQVRATLGREIGRGKVEASIKHMDDSVMLYTGIPLTFDNDGKVAGVPGFSARYGTVAGPESAQLSLRGPKGPLEFDLRDGTNVQLTQATLKIEQEIADGWKLENGTRYRDSDTLRNGFFPSSLQTGSAYLASRLGAAHNAFPGASGVQLRYVTSPTTIFDPVNQNGNGLVMDAAARSVEVEESEFINDLRLVKSVDVAGQTHDIAFGFYVAGIDETFRRYSASTIVDVQDRGRLLDLVAVDAAGNVLGRLSENGVLRYGSEFANGSGQSTSIAFYASDEWRITDELRLDFGGRWEKMKTDGSVERSAAINLGQSATPADDTVLAGTGLYDHYDVSFDDVAWTIGGNWQFHDDMGLFARYTSTFRLPSIGDYVTNAGATPVVQEIKMMEAGYKLANRWLDLYATLFNTDYDSFRISDTVFNAATGGYDIRTVYAGTRTYGLELEGVVRPIDWFDLGFSATWQKPEFRNLRYTELVNGAPVERDYSNNQLLRVPKVSFRVTPGVNLLDGRLRAEMDVEHYGDRYADAANSQELPSYTVLNANVKIAATDDITLYLSGYNLTNEIGLTEGNPRAGELAAGQAGARYYIARPILGRNVRGSVLYRF